MSITYSHSNSRNIRVDKESHPRTAYLLQFPDACSCIKSKRMRTKEYRMMVAKEKIKKRKQKRESNGSIAVAVQSRAATD